MKAHELMTSNPECLTREDSLQRAAQLMRDLDVGSIPVVDDRSSMLLVGVITDRDITVSHVAEGHAECMVGDRMSSGGCARAGRTTETRTSCAPCARRKCGEYPWSMKATASSASSLRPTSPPGASATGRWAGPWRRSPNPADLAAERGA
jgi:hypothetical protein